jgi:hypothetical protein
MEMEKKMKHRHFLFICAIFLVMLNLNSALALEFASEGNERYELQINNLSCEIKDYELNLDLWHFSVAGSYTMMLNNSGDTDISIRWKNDDTQGEVAIPAKTVKKYSVNFRLNLLSMDFSYEYKEI